MSCGVAGGDWGVGGEVDDLLEGPSVETMRLSLRDTLEMHAQARVVGTDVVALLSASDVENPSSA